MNKKVDYEELGDIYLDLHKRFGALGGHKNTIENQNIVERKWLFELRKSGWTYDEWWAELMIRLDKILEDRKEEVKN